MDQLKEHPQIVELLDTLDKNGLMKEKNEVQSLVSYIGGMENTLTEMLGELQDMRREINLIHNNTLRSKCHTLVEKTEGKIRQGFSAVKKMKDNLIQSAGNAVRAFRERGRDALAESVRAMKIPEALDKLRGSEGEKNIRDKQNALITSLNLKLSGVSKKRTRLYEDFAEGILDEEEYTFAKKSYDEQFADLSRRLDEAESSAAVSLAPSVSFPSSMPAASCGALSGFRSSR